MSVCVSVCVCVLSIKHFIYQAIKLNVFITCMYRSKLLQQSSTIFHYIPLHKIFSEDRNPVYIPHNVPTDSIPAYGLNK